MKKFKVLLSFTFISSTTLLLAQGAPPATPIDGGLSILMAAAGAYGIKKVIDARRKS